MRIPDSILKEKSIKAIIKEMQSKKEVSIAQREQYGLRNLTDFDAVDDIISEMQKNKE